MTADRKHPSAAFWATVVLVVVLVGYPLSIGPACWLTSRLDRGAAILPIAYLPIIWIWDFDLFSEYGQGYISNAFGWYTNVGAAKNWGWYGYGTESEWRRSYH